MDPFDLTPDMRAQLDLLVHRVSTSPHNLVSRADRERLWPRHVVDSLTVSALLPRDTQRLMDIGTGGGFPGLVLAITHPAVEVHLVEATKKKARFLVEVASELGVEVTVHGQRAEDLATGPLRASFDVVTARAVAPLRRLVPWLAPFVDDDGVIIALKGDRWREELHDARTVIDREGLEVVATPERTTGGDEHAARPPKVVMLARVGLVRP